MNFILTAIIVLTAIAFVAALILFYCSKKFHVQEDPRLEQVNQALPGANCGGCGYPGCSGLATALVKGADNGDIKGLFCPVGGNETMGEIAHILGVETHAAEPQVAVLRCNGACDKRPRVASYDGFRTCAILNSCTSGETQCDYGCLGCGDCVKACQFGAITMNNETQLPQVDEAKCTACGACVKVCPRNLLELRNKGFKNRRVYVACSNKSIGAVAIKNCKAACIGCSKCFKECAFDAIKIENNLSYIDFNKCKLCRKCVNVCPTGAIKAVNFPQKQTVEEAKA